MPRTRNQQIQTRMGWHWLHQILGHGLLNLLPCRGWRSSLIGFSEKLLQEILHVKNLLLRLAHSDVVEIALSHSLLYESFGHLSAANKKIHHDDGAGFWVHTSQRPIQQARACRGTELPVLAGSADSLTVIKRAWKRVFCHGLDFPHILWSKLANLCSPLLFSQLDAEPWVPAQSKGKKMAVKIFSLWSKKNQ